MSLDIIGYHWMSLDKTWKKLGKNLEKTWQKLGKDFAKKKEDKKRAPGGALS